MGVRNSSVNINIEKPNFFTFPNHTFGCEYINIPTNTTHKQTHNVIYPNSENFPTKKSCLLNIPMYT